MRCALRVTVEDDEKPRIDRASCPYVVTTLGSTGTLGQTPGLNIRAVDNSGHTSMEASTTDAAGVRHVISSFHGLGGGAQVVCFTVKDAAGNHDDFDVSINAS